MSKWGAIPESDLMLIKDACNTAAIAEETDAEESDDYHDKGAAYTRAAELQDMIGVLAEELRRRGHAT